MEQSIFAKALQRMFDDSNVVFSRDFWAGVLGVSEEALNDWVSDVSLPWPSQIYVTVDCIKQSDGPQEPADEFMALYQRLLKEISHAANQVKIPFWDLIQGISEDEMTLDDYINTPLQRRHSFRTFQGETNDDTTAF